MRCEGLSTTEDSQGLTALQNTITASIKSAPEDDKRSHLTEGLEKTLPESSGGVVDKLHSLCALYTETKEASSTSTVGSYGKTAGSFVAVGLVGALVRKLKKANKKVSEAEVNLESTASTGTTGETREAQADLVVASDRASEVLSEASAVAEQVPRGTVREGLMTAVREFEKGSLRRTTGRPTATQGGKRKGKGKGKATGKRKH